MTHEEYENIISDYHKNHKGWSVNDFLKTKHSHLVKDFFLHECLHDYESIYDLDKDEYLLYQNPDNRTDNIILRRIDDCLYLCQTELNRDHVYHVNYLAIVHSNNEIESFKQKYIEWLEEKKKFQDIKFEGTKTSDDYEFEIYKNTDNLVIFTKKDKDLIGDRIIEFSPFECYLKLGIFTVCGSSDISEPELIGTGLGKEMYGVIDNLLPYQQIPHGYAGSPYKLSEDSTRFWQKRNQHRVTPIIHERFLPDEKHLSTINKNLFKENIMIANYFLSQLPGVSIRQTNNGQYVLSDKYRTQVISKNKDMEHSVATEDYMDYVKEKILEKITDCNDSEVMTLRLNGVVQNISDIQNKIQKQYPEFQFDDSLLYEIEDLGFKKIQELEETNSFKM